MSCDRLQMGTLDPESRPARERLRAYRALRDALPGIVAEARAAGVPWAMLESDAGMTRRGLAKAMERRNPLAQATSVEPLA